MFNQFHITKTLFQNCIHERFSFTLNYQGNDYQGIYHDGIINWFNPHPSNKIGVQQLDKVESNVTTKMHQLLVTM